MKVNKVEVKDVEVKIILDSREAFLKKEFDNSSIIHTVQQLFVGDIIIGNHIFERKTYSDLYSSIISKRFEEQRERLKDTRNNNPQCVLIYLIEGGIDTIKKEHYKIVNGAIENLILFHGISVMYSLNVHESAILIQKLHAKIIKKGGLVTNGEITQMKKSQKITDNIFLHQLTVIPGVSIQIAQKITQLYPNVGSLILNFNEKGENLLTDIQMEKRKIGKTLSRRIHEFYIL